MPDELNSAPDLAKKNVPDVSGMSDMQLRSHIERCQRLMRQQALLERLPDRGACVKHRYSVYTAELDKRDKQLRDHSNFEEKGYSVVTAQRSLGGEKNNSHKKICSEEGKMPLDKNYFTYLRMIEEKYKDTKVPVEEIVRRMYEGSLSEVQIRQILDDIPPNYFLTHRETCERSRDMVRWARKEELLRLQGQSLSKK